MCGLIAVDGSSSPSLMTAARRAAMARGPHSWGWALLSPGASTWIVHRGTRAMPGPPRGFAGLAVGHCRLATSSDAPGDTPDAAEGQPLTADGWLLAHNGSFRAPPSLAPHDSRSLLRLAEGSATVTEAAQLIAAEPRYAGAPQAVILAEATSRLVAAVRVAGRTRDAHPLYLTEYAHGWLLTSAPVHPSSDLLPLGVTTIARST